MKKQLVLLIAAVGICASSVSSAWSYDTKLAESYAKMFAPARGAAVGKELRFVSPEGYVKALQAGTKFVNLDVRTPEEAKVLGIALPNSLAISIDQLFQPENLAKLPTDKSIMVICKSGARAGIAATALRSIGFDDVYILKGGFEGLAAYYGAKQAYPPPVVAQPTATK
jgi:rhodanese-related sulfurtransferase